MSSERMPVAAGSSGNLSQMMDRLNQITECSICAETFVDPRVLPCIHTYCLRCLQGAGERLNLRPGQKMSCPLCRDEFVVPENGFQGIRKNFFMVNLIEMRLVSDPVDEEKLCEVCLENRDDASSVVPPAKAYCVDCRQRLCNHCSKEHKKQKPSKSHQLLKLGTPFTDDLAKKFGPNNCEQHPGKPTDLYCSNCKLVICMMCFAESHNSHQCTDVMKKAESFRTQIAQDVADVSGCLGQLTRTKTSMEKEKEKFVKELDDCKSRIMKRNEELKQSLDRHTKSLLDEVASLEMIGLEEFKKEMDEMDRYLNTMRAFKNYCEEMKCKGTPSDVCRSREDLRVRTGELKELHDLQMKRPICSLDVSFRVTQNEDYVNRNPNMVGEIKGTATKLRNKVIATSNRAAESRLTGRLDLATRQVRGVAALDKRLYVLLVDAILVYDDQPPFLSLTELTVPGMKTLVDIAPCPNYMCLYITDRDKSRIWRLTSEHNASVMLSDIGNPYTLSVSSEGNVVTVRWGQPSSIEIYGPDALLAHLVTLGPDVVLPYHAVQTSTGTVIVSHGGKDNKTHRILELSLDGRILHAFPGNPSSIHLNCPMHLALDADDRVFVADYYNSVVLLLRCQLDLDRVLALEEKDGVRRPNRICFSAERKTLYVVNGNKFVDIYSLGRSSSLTSASSLEEMMSKSTGSDIHIKGSFLKLS